MTPLRKRMIEALELRGMSPKTTRLYVDCVARLARYYNRSPGALDAEQSTDRIMIRPHRLEVADVFRKHADEYLTRYGATTAQRQVIRAVQNCRAAVLGGHVEACDRCGHQQVAYNSCRNRHCPKCQGSATVRWLQAREAELLPVPYFHLVFTLPAALGPLALQNPRVVYGLLLQAAAQTLLEVAANPKHLGAEIGFLVVLHTWGQNLMHHPHVHCVIPAGGLAPTAPAGFVPGRSSFCRFASLVACFAVSSSTA